MTVGTVGGERPDVVEGAAVVGTDGQELVVEVAGVEAVVDEHVGGTERAPDRVVRRRHLVRVRGVAPDRQRRAPERLRHERAPAHSCPATSGAAGAIRLPDPDRQADDLNKAIRRPYGEKILMIVSRISKPIFLRQQ